MERDKMKTDAQRRWVKELEVDANTFEQSLLIQHKLFDDKIVNGTADGSLPKVGDDILGTMTGFTTPETKKRLHFPVDESLGRNRGYTTGGVERCCQ
jgi:hypothetical protein